MKINHVHTKLAVSLRTKSAPPAQSPDSVERLAGTVPAPTLEDKLKILAGSVRRKLDDGLLPELETARRGRAPETGSTQVLADNRGRVSHMALMYNSRYGHRSDGNGDAINQELLGAYQVLFTAMEPDTKFTIAIGSEEDQAELEQLIQDNNVANPERIKFVNSRSASEIWTRDVGLVLEDLDNPDKAILMENRRQRASGVTEDFAEQDGNLEHLSLRYLNIAGGDVVANDKEAFVGEFSIRETSRKLSPVLIHNQDLRERLFEHAPGEDEHGARWAMLDVVSEQMLERVVGKPVTVLGRDDPDTPDIEEGEAAFHVDLCTTPMDESTMLLGSPRLFKELFQSMTPEEMEAATKVLEEATGKSWADFERLIEKTEELVIPEEFDAYQKTLEKGGYEVEKLPYWYASDSKSYNWPNGMPSFTFNNCILEDFEKNGERVKRVFLPTTGIEKFDSYAVSTYEQQGYEVHPMKMLATSTKQGTLRCVCNVLGRSVSAKPVYLCSFSSLVARA